MLIGGTDVGNGRPRRLYRISTRWRYAWAHYCCKLNCIDILVSQVR